MNYRYFLTIILLSLAFVACGGSSNPAASASAAPASSPAGEQVFQIEVTSEGFVPNKLTASVNKPIKLVVTRKTDKTCATEIVIKDYGIKKSLPLNQPVEVTFTPTKTGKVRFACGMDMIAGEIEVK